MAEKSLNRTIEHQIRKRRSTMSDLENDVIHIDPKDMKFSTEKE